MNKMLLQAGEMAAAFMNLIYLIVLAVVAVVIANKDSVRVEPVVDATKIALTFFTAIGFMIATLGKMKSGK